MSRAEFMRKLAELLADVSPAEREEAIQYYNDYFDDAGAENEQSVIASLGTPEQLAKSIKAGLSDGGNTGEFTEKGFSGYEQRNHNEVLNPESAYSQHTDSSYQNGNYQNGYAGQNAYAQEPQREQKKEKMSAGSIVLIVLLCILASPLIIGIGGGLLGGVIGVIGGVFGIVVGFGAAAVALLIAGVCLFVYGITLLFGAPLAGLCTIGAAMVCAAVGLLFLWFVVMICGALIPAAVRGIVKIFQRLFPNRGNKGGAAA
ncbi:MAG: DUF1700 domain-containing protein [Bacillus sp. (in: Bacteria)]|nr:DUF1700 domain-containing protein [Bacillus sp. (in: firmicutes)]MCM1428043.1 DUF1700 domain-containing protein [Eubacterium sp.]